MSARGYWWCQIIGWLLFVVSALFFTVASWRAGDEVAIAGSLAFLVACFIFLFPLVREIPPRE